MKRLLISALFAVIVLSARSQGQGAAANPVKWYTIQEAEKMIRQSPRPLFIDTYTDWCGWCKKMDKETFADPVISEILNTKFYPVKFNAEGSESITFLGQKFINDGKAGKTHQLAIALLNGQMAYPTVVFMFFQADGKPVAQAIPGYKQAREMEMLLGYFSDKTYEKQSWEDFQKNFKGKIQ